MQRVKHFVLFPANARQCLQAAIKREIELDFADYLEQLDARYKLRVEDYLE